MRASDRAAPHGPGSARELPSASKPQTGPSRTRPSRAQGLARRGRGVDRASIGAPPWHSRGGGNGPGPGLPPVPGRPIHKIRATSSLEPPGPHASPMTPSPLDLRLASLAERADPHPPARRRRGPGLALLASSALALWGAACGGAEGGSPSDGGADTLARSAQAADLPPVSERGRAQIERLVQALTPLDLDLTSDHHDRWLHAGRALREELRRADPEVGVAALWRLRDARIQDPLLRRGLLEVGSHAAPDVARPLLVTLIEEYGHDFAVRTFAVEFLSETSPQTALEVLEPHLRKRRKPNKTMPPDEFLVRGYARAAQATGEDPTAILADVATNLWMEDAARHFAVAELGRYPSPYARSVLEAILIESTGNSYIRRKAAQALRDSVPAEAACETFRRVANHEAELGMLEFLLDMIRENCP